MNPIHNQKTLEEALDLLQNATVKKGWFSGKLENLTYDVVDYWQSTGRLVHRYWDTVEDAALMYWDRWEPMPDIERLSAAQKRSLEEAWLEALGFWEFGDPVSFPEGGKGDVIWLTEFKEENVADWYLSAFEKVTEEVEV